MPVAALEWRIKEDVPVNLLAVKKAVESGHIMGSMACEGVTRAQPPPKLSKESREARRALSIQPLVECYNQ